MTKSKTYSNRSALCRMSPKLLTSFTYTSGIAMQTMHPFMLRAPKLNVRFMFQHNLHAVDTQKWGRKLNIYQYVLALLATV